MAIVSPAREGYLQACVLRATADSAVSSLVRAQGVPTKLSPLSSDYISRSAPISSLRRHERHCPMPAEQPATTAAIWRRDGMSTDTLTPWHAGQLSSNCHGDASPRRRHILCINPCKHACTEPCTDGSVRRQCRGARRVMHFLRTDCLTLIVSSVPGGRTQQSAVSTCRDQLCSQPHRLFLQMHSVLEKVGQIYEVLVVWGSFGFQEISASILLKSSLLT